MSAAKAEVSEIEPIQPKHIKEFRIGLVIVAVLVPILYGATMARWIGLGDTALVIDEIVAFKVNSHVNNHTWAIVFGWLFSQLPFGELAFRINMMSVFFGSIAMLLMYVIAYRTLKRLELALIATGTVALMHSMWWHSTIIENYAINACTLLATMLLLFKDEERDDNRYYYAACVMAGVAIVNHVQMGTLSVCVFVYAILQRNKGDYGLIKRWFKMGCYFLVGLAPYLIILIKDISRTGDASKVVYWATGGDFQSRMFDANFAKVFRPLVMEFLVQFPSPILLLIGLGVYWIGERSWYAKSNVAITVVFLINTFFFAQFHTWDKFAFLLPSFLVAAYWGIVGTRAMFILAKRHGQDKPWLRYAALGVQGLCLVMPVYIYKNLPRWGGDAGFWHARFNNNYTFNTHNCATYIANPDKSSWSDVNDFAMRLFDKLPPNAIFFDDDSRNFYPLQLYFQRHLGMRKDMRILMMNTWGFENWGLTEDAFINNAVTWLRLGQPVFLTTIDSPMDDIAKRLTEHDIVAKRFDLDETHWVYKLVKESDGPIRLHDVVMGRRFDARNPVLKMSFDRRERIGARFRFAPTAETMEVRFRWRDPSGEVYHLAEPFSLEAGNTAVWSHMEDPSLPRSAGEWTVELTHDDEVLASWRFDVTSSG